MGKVRRRTASTKYRPTKELPGGMAVVGDLGTTSVTHSGIPRARLACPDPNSMEQFTLAPPTSAAASDAHCSGVAQSERAHKGSIARPFRGSIQSMQKTIPKNVFRRHESTAQLGCQVSSVHHGGGSLSSLLFTALVAVPLLMTLAACGSGGGGGNSSNTSGTPGDELNKPDGSGTFFVDPNSNGRASRMHIAEVFWGRLVDVHDIDGQTGAIDPSPAFRDWVINENVLSDGTSYVLETNPITQLTRLVIQREKGLPAVNGASFTSLLNSASVNLPPIQPKHDDGTSTAPFSLMARNACLVVRIDDLMDDSDADTLADKVRLVTGYRPSQPFAARVIFDPNHGGIAYDNEFHSSRILLDMTVSEAEAAASTQSLVVNSLGLPPSLQSSTDPNVSLRIPTQIDFATGLFEVLQNVGGGEMDMDLNGPIDNTSSTLDLVRAMRAGNGTDQNNGFMLDLNLPEVLGSWPLSVTGAANDPGGVLGFDFVIDLSFQTLCQARPLAGNIIQLGNKFLEVTAPGTVPQGGAVP
ncbi:MAG: hypothetical protein ACI9K5_003640, partial [Gammaproteobacteria bacterium]